MEFDNSKEIAMGRLFEIAGHCAQPLVEPPVAAFPFLATEFAGHQRQVKPRLGPRQRDVVQPLLLATAIVGRFFLGLVVVADV